MDVRGEKKGGESNEYKKVKILLGALKEGNIKDVEEEVVEVEVEESGRVFFFSGGK